VVLGIEPMALCILTITLQLHPKPFWFYFVLRQNFTLPFLGLPWTCNPPTSTSSPLYLRLQVCTTTPSLLNRSRVWKHKNSAENIKNKVSLSRGIKRSWLNYIKRKANKLCPQFLKLPPLFFISQKKEWLSYDGEEYIYLFDIIYSILYIIFWLTPAIIVGNK
jgi:hypothetical protein